MMNDRARWLAALERYGVTLSAVGGALRGPCPFHRGSNPTSFVVTPEKGFHCFACGVGGGLSQFIQRMGGEVPAITTSFWRPVADGRSDAVITPIGPLDAGHPYLAERGIHTATARFFGMGYFAGRPPLGDRIVIPLHDADGALVGHVARRLDDTEPRYWFQREVPRKAILFNLHRVKAAKHDTVVLVEGVFDAAAVHQLGMPNVVASLSCQVSANQRALLSRFRRVFVLFDADAAGAEATRAIEAELGPAAVRVALPKADPCSLKGVVLDRLLRSAMESDRTSIRPIRGAKGLAR
jgi:DNA primase